MTQEASPNREPGCCCAAMAVAMLGCLLYPGSGQQKGGVQFVEKNWNSSNQSELSNYPSRRVMFCFDHDKDGLVDEAVITNGYYVNSVDAMQNFKSGQYLEHLVADGVPKEKQVFIADFTKRLSEQDRASIAYVHSLLGVK